ncbi:PP2C family protein-serine/threonine phosphatase [Streptomyces sp. NPDC048560]|uniref:PP2C family protein-serine/threonine phosphatase n=1 Tax=Streptomyces sp. NPDC048560 TaxID=3155488 RepID=UPI00342F4DC8
MPDLEAREAAAGASRIGNGALAGLVMAFTSLVVVLDYLIGADLQVIPLLVVAPALASVYCTVRQTVSVAVWITAVVVVSRVLIGGSYGGLVLGIVFTMLACGLGVGSCAARIRHAVEIARLRTTAGAIQRQILHPLPVLTDQVHADGLYEPIEEDRLVGGDIYEVVESPHGTRVVIGDVQGKGLAAMGAGIAVLGAFREAAIREATLTGVAAALEDAVVRHNASSARSGEAERFVTALVLGFDTDGRVEAVNCGHIAPRLLHDGAARVVRLGRTSVPLGMADLSPEKRTAEHLGLPAGATLLVCTDGVTEARDASGSFYPLDERLAGWVRREPREVLQALRDDLEAFTGGVRRDDIAVLALRGVPAPGEQRPEAPSRAERPAAELVSEV